jgi:hypothetical protein
MFLTHLNVTAFFVYVALTKCEGTGLVLILAH